MIVILTLYISANLLCRVLRVEKLYRGRSLFMQKAEIAFLGVTSF